LQQQTVNILCMKWGDKYGAEYVNRLHSMVSRNLSVPFRFICFTEKSEGVSQQIECLPILDVNADLNDSDGLKRVQAWKKLTTLADPLYDISGTCLFLDLDVVILGNIDCFFEVEGEFFIIKDWHDPENQGNSSVYRFQAGQHGEVLNYFVENRNQIVNTYINEQHYLSQKIKEISRLDYWPDDWCISYRKSCLPKNRLARWFTASKEPEQGKIIIFHGAPNPEEALLGKGDRWYRPLKPAPWLEKYWR